MALPLKKTLAELRSAILARCGYASQGAPAARAHALLNDILEQSQTTVWWDFREFGELKTIADFSTVIGQTKYDWPDTVDPNHRTNLSVFYGSTWIPLKLGITPLHDTFVENGASFPQRYDLGAQIELWPEPEDVYTVRIEHFRLTDRFSQDGDRTSLPDHLVHLKALYRAQLYYKKPEAAESEQSYQSVLARMRSGNHQGKRYIRGERGDRERHEIADVYPRPQMVP